MGKRRRKRERLVLWTQLVTPGMDDAAVLAGQRVAARAAQLGYNHLTQGYRRMDDARNKAVVALAAVAEDDKDTLVMLDGDHTHPMDIIERLVGHDVGVVGAMAFRRGEPFDVCAYRRREEDGGGAPHRARTLGQTERGLSNVGREERGLQEVAIVGAGAIAIQRWVFERLMEKGFAWPYFRLVYLEGSVDQPGVDMYFGAICEEAGIPHYVDCDLVTPHLRMVEIDREYSIKYQISNDKYQMAESGEVDVC